MLQTFQADGPLEVNEPETVVLNTKSWAPRQYRHSPMDHGAADAILPERTVSPVRILPVSSAVHGEVAETSVNSVTSLPEIADCPPGPAGWKP